MTHTRKTGGLKEFRYSKEDDKRIESQDTESTKEFKESLSKHYDESPQRKKRLVQKEAVYHRKIEGAKRKYFVKRVLWYCLLIITGLSIGWWLKLTYFS